MSKIKIGCDQIATIVSQELQQWQMDGEAEMKRRIRKRARECRAKIARDSPRDSGKYAKSWASQTVYQSARGLRIIVFNRDYPGLTHLLEFGHAVIPPPKNAEKKDSKGKVIRKTYDRVSGFPHIKPAEEEMREGIIDDLIDVFGGS